MIVCFKKYQYAVLATYLCEDQELLLRAHIDSKFIVLPVFLLKYRLRANFSIINKIKTRLSLLKHQLRFFFTKKSYINLILSIFGFVFFCAKDLITKIKSTLKQNYI